jgi:hypothetical protein
MTVPITFTRQTMVDINCTLAVLSETSANLGAATPEDVVAVLRAMPPERAAAIAKGAGLPMHCGDACVQELEGQVSRLEAERDAAIATMRRETMCYAGRERAIKLVAEGHEITSEPTEAMAAVRALRTERDALDANLMRMAERLADAEIDRDTLAAKLAEAEKNYTAVAEAAGIMYEPDMGPCWPGPVEAVVDAIRGYVRQAGADISNTARIVRKLSSWTPESRAGLVRAIGERWPEAVAGPGASSYWRTRFYDAERELALAERERDELKRVLAREEACRKKEAEGSIELVNELQAERDAAIARGPCEECGGLGYIEAKRNPERNGKTARCDDCGGTGREPADGGKAK